MSNNLLNELWTEKYRPKNINDIILPEIHKQEILLNLKEKNIPHYLFIGAPGTGKTSLALVIINELNANYLILNASDERGIDTIRNKVGNFVKVYSDKPKIIFLDEADNLTPDAQTSLRNLMETYSKYCRFIFTGNYDKFIEPIKDRCKIIKFRQLNKNECINILKNIALNENIEYINSDLNLIVDKCYPSIRKMISTLQEYSIKNSDKYILKLSTNLESNDTDSINKQIFKLFLKRDIYKIRELLYDNGITDFISLYKYFFDVFLNKKKEKFCLIVVEYMYRDSIVADKEINFIGMLISLYNRAFPFIFKNVVDNKNNKTNNKQNVGNKDNNFIMKNNIYENITTSSIEDTFSELPIYKEDENENNSNVTMSNSFSENKSIVDDVNSLIKNNQEAKHIDDVINKLKI